MGGALGAVRRFDWADVGATLEARGSADPATWMPANRSYWCDYVSDWVTVKLRWGLSADPAELKALNNIATTMHCP